MNALAIILAAQVASAQTMCGPSSDVIANFRAKHGEEVKWTGHAQKGAMMLMTSRKGTWSLFMLPTPEIAGLIGAGKGSRELFGEPA